MTSVLQCVAVCVAVCCSVLQCVAVCIAVYCSVLQCVAVCCTDFIKWLTDITWLVCCSVLQCVLQCVAVCCNYFIKWLTDITWLKATELWEIVQGTNSQKSVHYKKYHMNRLKADATKSIISNPILFLSAFRRFILYISQPLDVLYGRFWEMNDSRQTLERVLYLPKKLHCWQIAHSRLHIRH